jgi:DNA polymerase-3 subunit alpha
MIHLHTHTLYSKLDGLIKFDQYCQKAKDLGFKAITITDHGVIDGAIKFQNACDEYGLKSIIGCELYVVKNAKIKNKSEKPYHLTCLVRNQDGLKNLLSMLSIANQKEHFYHKPRVDFDILEKYKNGLLFLSGCAFSILNTKEGIDWFTNQNPKNVFFELMPHNLKEQKRINRLCLKLHKKNPDINYVASNDCHYIDKDDMKAHEVLLAIQTGSKWKDKKRFKFNIDGMHIRSKKEMIDAFKKQGVLKSKQIQIALKNTNVVGEMCDFRIKKQKPSLPVVTGDLKQSCFDGYQSMFGKKITRNRVYYKRFKAEYNIIKSKGFEGYFLIVKDIIDFAKKNNIMVGGRGSVSASLIAYLLGIVYCDPIKFKLLFSRFLTKDRIDFPDIDMDFENHKRDEIVNYLKYKYGNENIANIGTFIKMKSKQAIRDVMRVFDFPMIEINEVSKNIDTLGDLDNMPFGEKYPDIVRIAKTLEGTIKSIGVHAAGYVISDKKLSNSDRCHLSLRKGKHCINWEMDDAEYIGLVKIDILGLEYLSILNNCKRRIENETQI